MNILEQNANKQLTFTQDNRPYIYASIREETKWMPTEALLETPTHTSHISLLLPKLTLPSEK